MDKKKLIQGNILDEEIVMRERMLRNLASTNFIIAYEGFVEDLKILLAGDIVKKKDQLENL